MPDINERAAPAIHSAALGHGVSWAAIFAGAAGAASLSLVLLLLGVGLGVSSVSPWAGAGLSAGALGASAIAWLAFTQLAASGMGGYLAGRLRSRWSSIHADEVYFRDTAHGFLAWSVATLLTAALLGGAVSSVIGAGAQAASTAAGAAATVGAAGAAASMAPSGQAQGSATSGVSYAVDTLFRQDAAAPAPAGAASAPSMSAPASPAQTSAPPLAEVGRIFAQAGQSDAQAIPQDDLRYVGQMVASRAGIPQAEAEKRVSDAYAKLRARAAEADTKAREAADAARKATAHASIWMVVALLVGAFVASFAATIGGRRRDF